MKGIRDKLLKENAYLLEMESQRIEQFVNKFNHQVDSENLEDIERYPCTIQALRTERTALQKISTWPWDVGTVRGFATTFLVPVFLWLITHYLDRFF